eukprot:GHUV01042636.1.p1 GENE.GHUV01042636.1~~GHUV01042636.1.p1  ORF type:complete len:157 (-),score=38.26 GHUV01042636.1:43-513(-)
MHTSLWCTFICNLLPTLCNHRTQQVCLPFDVFSESLPVHWCGATNNGMAADLVVMAQHLLHTSYTMLQEHNVNNVDVVKQLIEEANHRRSVGSTAANADSSRSHSIMQFALKRFIAGGAHSRLVSTCASLHDRLTGSTAAPKQCAVYRDVIACSGV